MALPEFFRWEISVITGEVKKIYQWLYIFEADGSLALFDRDETVPEGWRLLTDQEWDDLHPVEPEEPPTDPEPQE